MIDYPLPAKNSLVKASKDLHSIADLLYTEVFIIGMNSLLLQANNEDATFRCDCH
jgi:hypothetical protein